MGSTSLRLGLAIAGAALVLPGFAPAPAAAAGDLLIAPTRLVFEGKDRTAALSITNTGHQSATYRISWLQRRMTEAGSFEDVTAPAPGERFADELVRFSPQQVVLPPGVAQTVRLMLRKPAGLEPGEYRSHLLFRAVPSGAPPEGSAEGPLGIRLTAIYGVSIPVIVRQGETHARVAIEEVRLGDGRLSLTLAREGNRSVYGDLVATFEPEGGSPRRVGQLKGLAVYTPNAQRRVAVPLSGTLGRGTLRVRFAEGGPALPQAERTIEVP